MKKLLLSVIAFALITTSCNKYKDDFKNLNARLDALAAQIQGVSTLVAGIQSSQLTLAQLTAALGTATGPLATQLTALTATVNNINSVLATVASGTQSNTAAIATLTTLVTNNQTAALAAIAGIQTSLTNAIASINLNTNTQVAAAQAALAAAITAAQNNINASTAAAITAAQIALDASITAAITNINGNTNAQVLALSAQLTAATTLLDAAITAAQNAIIANDNANFNVLKAIVDALTVNLAIANAQIQTLLSSNNVFVGDINIFDEASLAAAEALGAKVRVVTGNVTINTTGLDAGQMIRLKAVTDGATLAGTPPPDRIFIGSINGNLTVSGNQAVDLGSLVNVGGASGNVSLDGANHDLSALLSVTGDYSVTTSDVMDDALLSVGGNMTLSYVGAYSYPNLTTVGGVLTAVRQGVNGINTTLISFPSTTSSVVFNDGVQANGVLRYDGATSVNIGGSASLTFLRVNGSATSVTLGEDVYTGGSLTVWAGIATTANLSVVSVNGPVTLWIGDLKTLAGQGATTINLNSFTSSTGPVDIQTSGLVGTSIAGTVNMPLYSANQDVAIDGPLVQTLPSYAGTALPSTISSGTIQTLTLAVYRASHSLGAQFDGLTALRNLTLGAARGSITETSFAGDGAAALQTLNVTYAAFGTAYQQNVNLNTMANLTTVSVTSTGELNGIYLTNNPALTSVTTAGMQDVFNVTNNDAVGLVLNMGNTAVTSANGIGSWTTVVGNANLTSFTTSTSYMRRLDVQGNPLLTSVNFSSFVAGQNITSGTVEAWVQNNGLSGSYTASIFATNTAPVMVQAGLSTLKAYMNNLYGSMAHTVDMSLGFGTGAAPALDNGVVGSVKLMDDDQAAFVTAGGTVLASFVQRDGDGGAAPNGFATDAGERGSRINTARELSYLN